MHISVYSIIAAVDSE